MARYIEVEREPECRLFDVPLMATATLADALCCQGPRRDFATEQDFRLRNAAKMYPDGYSLGSPYIYDNRIQYTPAPLRQVHHVPFPPVSEVPPVVRLENMDEPTYCHPYPTQAAPEPPSRVYRYEKDALFHFPRQTVAPLTSSIERPIPESTKTNWEASPPFQPYLQEQMAPPARLVLTTTSTQPGNTPRDDQFIPSWPGTVEIIKIEERTVDFGTDTGEDVESLAAENPYNENEQDKGEAEANKAPPASRKGQGSGKKAAARKEARSSKLQAEAQKDQKQKKDTAAASPSRTSPSEISASPDLKAAGASPSRTSLSERTTSPGLKKKDVSTTEEGNEQKNQKQQEEPPASFASIDQPDATEFAQQKKDQESAEIGIPQQGDVSPPEENERQKSKQGKKEKQEEVSDDSDVFSSEDLVIAEETERLNIQVATEADLGTKEVDEGMKQDLKEGMRQDLPTFSTFTASTFPGPAVASPRVVKIVGDILPPSYEAGKPRPDSSTGWPVGYVPPEDHKYKELMVGNQVFLEGGTFYLTETGAYLLGLHD